jgi:hypothetical protein
LTSFPAGGDSPFDPEHFNEEFGSHWTVPPLSVTAVVKAISPASEASAPSPIRRGDFDNDACFAG